jgi:hypothetical protein
METLNHPATRGFDKDRIGSNLIGRIGRHLGALHDWANSKTGRIQNRIKPMPEITNQKQASPVAQCSAITINPAGRQIWASFFSKMINEPRTHK